MSVPSTPPKGDVTLTQNARTVLEKRYLIKNEKGKPVRISSGESRRWSLKQMGGTERRTARWRTRRRSSTS